MGTHVRVRPVVARFPTAWGEGATGTVTYRYGRDEVTLTTRAATLAAAEAEQADALARCSAGRSVTKTWESVVHAIDGEGTVAVLTTTWAVEAKTEERAMKVTGRVEGPTTLDAVRGEVLARGAYVTVIAEARGEPGDALCSLADASMDEAERRIVAFANERPDETWELVSESGRPTAGTGYEVRRVYRRVEAAPFPALATCERCATKAVSVVARADGAVLCDACAANRSLRYCAKHDRWYDSARAVAGCRGCTAPDAERRQAWRYWPVGSGTNLVAVPVDTDGNRGPAHAVADATFVPSPTFNEAMKKIAESVATIERIRADRIVTDPPRPAARATPPPLPTHVCADCGGRITRGPSGLPCCAACAARLGAAYRGPRAVALASRRDESLTVAPDEDDYRAARPGRRWLTALLTVAGVASGWFGRETLEAARSLAEHARTWWPW